MATFNGPLQPHSTFNWKTGGAKIRSTLHTVDPHQCFGWTGRAFGVFAVHNWTISETGGKTIVTVDESMDGILPLLIKDMFQKNLEKGMQAWLCLLKEECEK
jgi:hypothetical protein